MGQRKWRILMNNFNAEQHQNLIKAGMFRSDLGSDEIEDFKQWARNNFKPDDDINECWHPVVVQECLKIKAESNDLLQD
jgi:hypothetical protein